MTSIEELFPVPSRSGIYWDQTPHSPPGATPESNVKLVEFMRLNDKRYHTFFNELGYHKYVLVCKFRSLFRRQSMVVKKLIQHPPRSGSTAI